MDKELKPTLFLIVLILLCGTGYTDAGGFAISGKLGTLGLGGELTTGMSENINARIGLNRLDFDFDNEIEDVDYDVGLDFSSFSAIVDWYIFKGSFRISGGIVLMKHELTLDSMPTVNIEIGDNTYSPAQINRLSGNIEYDNFLPYIGFGFGNPLKSNKRWGFYTDIGVIYAGSPDVRLTATGAGAATLATDLAKEVKHIQDDFDVFKFYPVASLGLFYKF